jgi:hypothetical protein
MPGASLRCAHHRTPLANIAARNASTEHRKYSTLAAMSGTVLPIVFDIAVWLAAPIVARQRPNPSKSRCFLTGETAFVIVFQ